jgi:putative ubiquitin-RnfH superfamily antitoxin RatB of RatAB toxin-antitoxin module
MRCTVAESRVEIEVAYGGVHEQVLIPVVAEGALNAREAIERSGVTRQFPEIDLAVNKVGIYGKLIPLDHALESGDRVEIYRPLIADPKEQRKKRAAEGKVMRKGAGGE